MNNVKSIVYGELRNTAYKVYFIDGVDSSLLWQYRGQLSIFAKLIFGEMKDNE
jgi:hypothetical protein